MSEQKTLPTDDSVAAFLAAVPDARRREDAERLCALMTEVTGEPAVMWGGSIIGFGAYHYRYASGHEGDAPVVGFSPRAKALSLYLSTDLSRHQATLDRLGKHKLGKGCLYVTRLSDVDETVLAELIRACVTPDAPDAV